MCSGTPFFVAYELFFSLLKNVELKDEIKKSYEKFISRFDNDENIKNDLFSARVRHWLATMLDEEFRFQDSLEQYNKVISIARGKSKSIENVSRLITTATFSKANCLEKLGKLKLAESEFRALISEFNNSNHEYCRQASILAKERVESIARLLEQA